MNATLFKRLASIVTIADLIKPLQPDIRASATLAEALSRIEQIGSVDGQFFIVRDDDGQALGWIEAADLPDSASQTVGELMNPFKLDRLMSIETPALRAVRLVASGDPFEPWFALDGHELVGTIDYDCFFSPPFKTCLFALVMELEQRGLWLCAQNAQESWDVLPAGRKEKAEKLRMQRSVKRPPTDLQMQMDAATGPSVWLSYTMFCDKKTIILKRNLLPKLERSLVSKVFDWTEQLRNSLAHPDTYEEPFVEPQDLIDGITACDLVLHAINETLLPNAVKE